jgi:HAE1 family hydrophobic/amphiphilic exporter-1
MSAAGQPGPRSGGFYAGLVQRPVTLLVLFVALLVIGVIAYVKIPLQLMPDGIVEPGLWIQVFHPGASAQENEERVARTIEEQLRTLSGVEEIESFSEEDEAGFWVSFYASVDMDLAKAEVRDRIERARGQLPATVREIGIYSFSLDEIPIFWMPILYTEESDRTDFLVDNVIARRLEAVDGVGRVNVEGALDDSLRILLDEERVYAANLDLGQLIQRLSTDNFAQPLGEVTDGGRRFLLRSDMRFRTAEEIAGYPIGGGLTIGDVGRVIPVKSVRDRLARLDGRYSFEVEIQKDSQANTVATCERVVAAIAELEADPRLEQFEFLPLWNQGEIIEASLDQLRETAISGGWLAVLVLLLFLRRLRLTLAVALSIPFSVILAVAVGYFGGGTFNLLTMCGITLAVGMLVDNSIVVIENIERLRGEGLSLRAAAVQGTREVGLAVTLSTMTTIVVFLPVIFMTRNPILARMFAELGLPLCLALGFSLLAALVFLPVLVARMGSSRPPWVQRAAAGLAVLLELPARAAAYLTGGLRAAGHVLLTGLYHGCRAVLWLFWRLRWALAAGAVALAVLAGVRAASTRALRERLAAFGVDGGASFAGEIAVLAGLALAAAALALFGLRRWRALLAAAPARPARLVPAGSSLIDFMIALNHGLVAWSLRHRPLALLASSAFVVGAGIVYGGMEVAAFGEDEDTDRFTLHVELEDAFTLAEAEGEMTYYEDFFASKKEQYGFEHTSLRFDEFGGRVRLYWETGQTRAALEAVRRDVMTTLAPRPGHSLRYHDDEEADPERSKNLVTWRLVGPDSEELERYGQRALELLEGLPGLASVKPPTERSPGQVQIELDAERANALGVTADTALENIAWALRGWQLPRYQEQGREIPLIIEYDEAELAGLSTLQDLQIFTDTGAVPLTSFAELEFGRASRQINRINGQVSYTLLGSVESPLLQKSVSDAGYALLQRELDLPRGYSIGEEDLVSHRAEEELAELMQALQLSIVLVFLLMGILFESLLLPLSVLFTIPFAIAGAIWTLKLTGTTMDSIGWIGMIVLVGVVVNNGIVLIDRIHALRREGLSRAEAVLQGSHNRVRPIVMTALTTVMGLVPMAMTEPGGESFDYRALATCVAGGLTFSTLFTLWIVPVAYTLFDDLAQALAARAAWIVSRAPRPARASPLP